MNIDHRHNIGFSPVIMSSPADHEILSIDAPNPGSTGGKDHFTPLPSELLVLILKGLTDLADRSSVSLTSRRLLTICSSERAETVGLTDKRIFELDERPTGLQLPYRVTRLVIDLWPQDEVTRGLDHRSAIDRLAEVTGRHSSIWKHVEDAVLTSDTCRTTEIQTWRGEHPQMIPNFIATLPSLKRLAIDRVVGSEHNPRLFLPSFLDSLPQLKEFIVRYAGAVSQRTAFWDRRDASLLGRPLTITLVFTPFVHSGKRWVTDDPEPFRSKLGDLLETARYVLSHPKAKMRIVDLTALLEERSAMNFSDDLARPLLEAYGDTLATRQKNTVQAFLEDVEAPLHRAHRGFQLTGEQLARIEWLDQTSFVDTSQDQALEGQTDFELVRSDQSYDLDFCSKPSSWDLKWKCEMPSRIHERLLSREARKLRVQRDR